MRTLFSLQSHLVSLTQLFSGVSNADYEIKKVLGSQFCIHTNKCNGLVINIIISTISVNSDHFQKNAGHNEAKTARLITV